MKQDYLLQYKAQLEQRVLLLFCFPKVKVKTENNYEDKFNPSTLTNQDS